MLKRGEKKEEQNNLSLKVLMQKSTYAEKYLCKKIWLKKILDSKVQHT